MNRGWTVTMIVILVTTACQVAGSATATVAPPTATAGPTDTPEPSSTPRPTSTPRPKATATPSGPLCLDPADVTLDDVGTTVVICGRVVEEGEIPCDSCAYGAYSYLVFEGGFNVISYYWNFISYDNACLVASDKVEQLGSNPVFVYGAAEGFAGSECTRDSSGNLTCEQGEYFLNWDGCG